jgi:broad specificity phosphatase PhoE
MPMQKRWPERLWIVRHGESAGNVARNVAHAAGLPEIDIAGRDADVPLSPLGERQSRALGRWFAATGPDERPNVVLISPYRRAQQTAELIKAAGGLSPDSPEFIIDERLREKEFGILDRLTRSGIERGHPQQAEFRRLLGKFYHRPPGGESWCDVILRLRSALDTMSLHYDGCRVLVVAHQVVVLCLRYLAEHMTEEQILAIDAAGDVANCAVTEYRLDADRGQHGELILHRYNFVAPLEDRGTPVTTEPDAAVAAR